MNTPDRIIFWLCWDNKQWQEQQCIVYTKYREISSYDLTDNWWIRIQLIVRHPTANTVTSNDSSTSYDVISIRIQSLLGTEQCSMLRSNRQEAKLSLE